MIDKINKWLTIPTFLGVILALVLVGGNNQSGLETGSSGTRYPNGISADTTSPVEGEVRGSTLTITGATTLSGALSSTATLTQGGGVYATSTVGSVVPLLASAFDTENVIDVTLNVLDATLSFPATTTLTSFIPTSGQTRTLFVRNASTTATMDLTISGGTGVLLKKATTSAVIYGDTDGANFAKIDLIRKANTDIEALVTFFGD